MAAPVVVAPVPVVVAAGPPVAPGGLEYGWNRYGSDYNGFDLPEARPELCRDWCASQAQCRAFTYVAPGRQGPAPRCWLKAAIPPPNRDDCCTSGVVR